MRTVVVMKKTRLIVSLMALLTTFLVNSAYAKKAQIKGEYCYQYGDSESLVVAKEISYAMALRKAIEMYKAFISSTSIVRDGKLKKDLIEAIASGYVDNIQIVERTVKGRTVCTILVGYVNPQAVKKIIAKKVEKKSRRKEFEGVISNKYIKILNYKHKPLTKVEKDAQKELEKLRKLSKFPALTFSGFNFDEGNRISILYQAKTAIAYGSQKIIINCFDENGNPLPGESLRNMSMKMRHTIERIRL